MNIQDLGSLGELLAALATIATLIYLAIQIRQNTATQTVTMYDSAMSGFIEANAPISSSAQTAALWRKAVEDPSALTPDEEVQFEFLLRNYTNNLLKVYRLYQQGVFPEVDWNLFACEAKQFFSIPIARQFKESNHLFVELWADIDDRESKNMSFLNRPGFLEGN